MHTEIRRSRRKDRTEARRRQHDDDGIGHVGHVCGDPIAGHHALLLQGSGEMSHLAVQVTVGQTVLDPVFAPENHCVGVVAAAQQVFGKIQTRLRKPASTGHAISILENHPAHRSPDLAELPDRSPELGRLANRPGMQRRVVGQTAAPTGFGLSSKSGNVGCGNSAGIGNP